MQLSFEKPRGKKIKAGKEKQSRDAYSIGCIEVRCEYDVKAYIYKGFCLDCLF